MDFFFCDGWLRLLGPVNVLVIPLISVFFEGTFPWRFFPPPRSRPPPSRAVESTYLPARSFPLSNGREPGLIFFPPPPFRSNPRGGLYEGHDFTGDFFFSFFRHEHLTPPRRMVAGKTHDFAHTGRTSPILFPFLVPLILGRIPGSIGWSARV